MAKLRLKMTTAKEIRRAMNRVSNMVLNGEIEAKQANAIIYAANTCLNSIRTDEQEKRIDEVEKIINDQVN